MDSDDDIVVGSFSHGVQEVIPPITSRDTEFVKASEVHCGDELTSGRGTVTNRLNDSGLLTFETTTTTFMKDMHAPLERFVRDPNGKYGYEYRGEK